MRQVATELKMMMTMTMMMMTRKMRSASVSHLVRRSCGAGGLEVHRTHHELGRIQAEAEQGPGAELTTYVRMCVCVGMLERVRDREGAPCRLVEIVR
jgi:hypothetical protein